MARISIKNVVIKGVSSPDTVALVASDRGISPMDVFVRIVFDHNGKELKASNKLKYLGKTGYNTLLESFKNKKTIDISYDVEAQFFDIEYGTTVDSLFSTVTTTTSTVEEKSQVTPVPALNADALIGG